MDKKMVMGLAKGIHSEELRDAAWPGGVEVMGNSGQGSHYTCFLLLGSQRRLCSDSDGDRLQRVISVSPRRAQGNVGH